MFDTSQKAGGMMSDNNKPQGGTLDDTSRPDGHGKPSEDAPALASRQPVQIPTSFTRKKK